MWETHPDETQREDAVCDPVEQTLAQRQDDGVPTPSKFSRDPILVALGSAIRTRRKLQSLSQEQLADLAALDRSYIGQVERGENSIAILPLARVASALNTTLATLFGDAGL